MDFVKAHGCGNDFVLIGDLDDELELSSDLTKELCNRHFGIGADGAIRIGSPTTDEGAVFMDYRNADGSIAEMCGNGVRTVAKWYGDRHQDVDEVNVDTRAGTKKVTLKRGEDGLVEECSVAMGVPERITKNHKITLPNGATVPLTLVSMGNPHAIIVLGCVDASCVMEYPLDEVGEYIAKHEDFPEGTNVEVIATPRKDSVVGRIYERGVGETLASGTGSAAMAVSAIWHGIADRQNSVYLPGGKLSIDWQEDSGELIVTGPCVEVFTGTWDR